MTQKDALEILKMGKNVFVTGPAGSGKTHLINQYIEHLRKHDIDIGITASTGIAATHMGGVTIHSWAGIGIKSYLSDYDLEAMEEKQYLWKRFENVKVLIIDEVSMLHHFRLDLVDRVVRAMKRNNLPFGGIQVVLCGDFFQLPPVVRQGEPEAKFIYKAEAWREAGFTICYLEENYRQKNDVCLSILNEIRSGRVSLASRKHLQDRHNKKSAGHVEPTRLFTHNIDVDSLNNEELSKLTPDRVEYQMDVRGNPALIETLRKSCLAPEVLQLKAGARVMCVKNNFEKGYANGTLGVVVTCNKGADPVIRTGKDKYIAIERASWKIEEDGKVKAEICQYPLRLAWAITVHKSQGMSLDAIEVDLSKSFEPGMGYVALSRVRTLEGLTLLGINETALQVHEDVLLFDEELQEFSKDAFEKLHNMTKAETETQQKAFFERIRPLRSEAKLSAHQKTAIYIENKRSLADTAKEREVTIETVIGHIEKLVEEGSAPDIDYLKSEIPKFQMKKIEKACKEVFEETGEARLNPIKNKTGLSVSYKNVRLGRLLLGYIKKT